MREDHADASASSLASSFVLLGAVLVALLWSNSIWRGSYDALWAAEPTSALGGWGLALDLREWVNEGLMASFFMVAALEIRRELVDGELRDRRRAALPVIAAAGGMVVPAAIYSVVNAGGAGAPGWGIPMATDIAFALGVVAVAGRGLPSSLRLFLLTLAVVDDLGAIVVIAVFYSGGITWPWALVACLVVATAAAIRRRGSMTPGVLLGVAVVLWPVVHASGLHATLAGVALGFLAPASLEARLQPWTSFLVLPLFALANAGISLSTSSLADAFRSEVTWGVVIGLVVGKTAGIGLFAWIACRLRVAVMPTGVTWGQLLGVAAIAGTGFTVSLFVAGIAFDLPRLTERATVGILVASVLASILGSAILLVERARVKRAEGRWAQNPR